METGLKSKGIQLVCTKDNFDRVGFHTPDITTATDGRIIFSSGFKIIIESADRQKWLKLCNVPRGKAVVSNVTMMGIYTLLRLHGNPVVQIMQ